MTVDGEQVRGTLVDDRKRTTERVEALRRDLRSLEESVEGSTDDEHDPDGSGGLAVGRAQVQALIAQAEGHLADVDAALGRLDDGGYGRCERCGEPIGAARLEARPTARTCIRCAGGG